MTPVVFYATVGVTLFVMGLYALIVRSHLIRKILAANVMGSGVFVMFISLAHRPPSAVPDPVPQAMVLTGIVVAVSATALALVLTCRIHAATGESCLPEDREDPP